MRDIEIEQITSVHGHRMKANVPDERGQWVLLAVSDAGRSIALHFNVN